MQIHEKFFFYLSTIVLAINTSQGQVALERKKITKEISMEVPVTFAPMKDAELYTKYVSSRKPIVMFTSPDRQIDLGVNENSSPWTGNDLELLKSFYKANIANLFTEVNFLQEDLVEVGGRSFVVFEFTSKVTDEDRAFGGSGSIAKYTYLQYTIKDDRVLLFNFTAPARLRAEWQDTARRIMESIRIRQ